MRDKNPVSHNHCVFNLTFHVVFVTKFRRKCLTDAALAELDRFLPEYATELGLSILEIKGEADHLHFILQTTPTDRLSNIVGILKSKSSSFLISKKYACPNWGKLSRTFWSSGYFICSTGGVSIETLKKYIQNQGNSNPPHRSGIAS